MYDARFEPVSNRADWFEQIELIEDETNDVITDLSDIFFVLEVRRLPCCTPVLSATTDNGKITDLGGGVIQIHFPLSEMTGICAGTYEIGATIERDELIDQLLIGTITIHDGVVRK